MTLDSKQPSHILNDSKVLSELEHIHNDLINKSNLSKNNNKNKSKKVLNGANNANLIQALLNKDTFVSGDLEMMALFNTGLINTQNYKDDSDLLISMNEHLLDSCKQLNLTNKKLTADLGKLKNDDDTMTEIESLKKELTLLKQQLDSPSLLYLVSKAKSHNQTLLSDKDYNEMYSTIQNPSLNFLMEKAKPLDQLVVPVSECQALERKIESPSLLYLIQKAKGQGYTVISDTDYYNLQSSNEKPSLQYLKEKSESEYSHILLPNETYDEMTSNIESPSLLYLIQKAKLQKHTIISDKDYKSLMDTCYSPSLLHLIEKAKVQGYVIISKEDYSWMYETTQSPSTEFLTTKAGEMGNTLISTSEYQEMKYNAKSPSLLYLIQKAKSQHYTIISDDDYNTMYSITESPSLSFIKEKATSLEQVVIPSDEYQAMQDVVTHPPLTFLSSMALLQGYQVIADDSYDQLKHPSLDKLEEIAKGNGYKMLSLQNQDGTAITFTEGSDVSEEALIEQAEKLDFVIVPKEKFAELNMKLENPILTKDQIIEQAKLNNIEIQDLVTQHKGVSHMNYDDEYDITQENICDDITNLRSSAKSYGMLCVPETSFVATSRDTTPDENNIVLLPKSYFNSLLENANLNLNDIHDDDLLREVETRRLQKPLVENFTAFSSPNTSNSDEERSITPSSKNYTTHVSTKVNVGTSGRNSINAIPSNGTTRRSLSISNFNLRSPRRGKGVRTSTSVDGAVSLAAMAYVGDSNNIVSAISQTVIGEFVYKYFNRLGSFGGGETRHKRYMWIHPYSLTLYWSESNPVVEDPWHRKTKGVSILSVQSVVDNTTGPTKLYNKSIVVTTREKKIKFTCVDKQRHDVWYNALKYLIQRNTDGIDLKDVFGNPNDELYSGNILSLPNEVHHNTNTSVMHSQTVRSRRSSRRSSLSKFLR